MPALRDAACFVVALALGAPACLDGQAGLTSGPGDASPADAGPGDVIPGCPMPPAPCANQQGVCHGAAAKVCRSGAWDPCEADAYAAHSPSFGDETCDGLDNDCDGATDEDFDVGEPCDAATLPVCRAGLLVCDGPAATTCAPGPDAADGTACTDLCTADGVCLAGACSGPIIDCDDGDPCTEDTCDPAIGCGHQPRVTPACCDLTLNRHGGVAPFGRGTVEDVVVRDGLAYLAAGRLGLHIADVSNPDAPAPVGWLDTPGDAVAIELVGDVAYVADSWDIPGEDSGLRIIDVSHPERPERIADFEPLWLVKGLAIAGDHAFIAEYNKGLHVIDVSDPSAPAEAAELAIDETTGLFIAGGVAYVLTTGCDTASLTVVDIKDPLDPQPIGQQSTFCFPHGLYVDGDRAYVSDYSTIDVFDVGLPAVPKHLFRFDGQAGHRIVVHGDTAVTVGQSTGLRVFWVQADDTVSPLSGLALPGVGSALEVVDGLAYAGVSAGPYPEGDPTTGVVPQGGLHIADVLNPNAPVARGALSATGLALDVVLHGGRALVADLGGGLRIFDVSDPEHPAPVGQLLLDGAVRRVVASGDHAFLALDDGDYGPSKLAIASLVDPTAPLALGTLEVPGSDMSLAVAGDLVLALAQPDWPADEKPGGLRLIDVTDPAAPVELGHLDVGDYPYSVAVVGDRAYIATDGLTIVDIADPTTPTPIGSTEPMLGGALTVVGDRAYLAGRGEHGPLQVIDVADPAAPKVLGEVAVPQTSILGLAYADGYVYFASGDHGIGVVDVSDPTQPVAVGAIDTVSLARAIAVDSPFGFVADGVASLQVIRVGCQ